MFDQESDQQPPDATVAIEKRVDGLELHVSQSGPHQGRQVARAMNPLVELAESTGNLFRRGRNERRVSRPCPSDPVLRSANGPGLFVRTTYATHEPLVDTAPWTRNSAW